MMTLMLFLLDQRNGPDRLMTSSNFSKLLTNFIYYIIFIIVRAWLVFLCDRIIISFSYDNCHITIILPII
jgi:hypothetical protein